MKIEAEQNLIVVKEAFNGIAIESTDGRKLYVCLRDGGWEMKIGNCDWHMIHGESDFAVKPQQEIKITDDLPQAQSK